MCSTVAGESGVTARLERIGGLRTPTAGLVGSRPHSQARWRMPWSRASVLRVEAPTYGQSQTPAGSMDRIAHNGRTPMCWPRRTEFVRYRFGPAARTTFPEQDPAPSKNISPEAVTIPLAG